MHIVLNGSILAASLMASTVTAAPAIAQPQQRTFDIPAQPLASALLEFSRQSDVLLMVSPNLTESRRSHALKGSLATNEAIAQLLRGTDLRAIPNPKGGYGIERVGGGREVATALPSDDTIAGHAEGEFESVEIIVTAQKSAQRIQDVPLPVTAINTAALADSNQVRLQDYYTKVPGLSLTLFGNENAPQIAIRGVTTGGFTNPTVAILIDDVPFGATGIPGASPTVPDIDPGDLDHIEVLRGPQGTLYGAASIGGLLKFVTRDPSIDRVSGRVQAGISSVHGGDNIGHNMRGSLNVPLSDALAIRASGFLFSEPGYVDNLAEAERDINRRDSRGGRISALWRASNVFSVKLSAAIQHAERDGSDETDISLGAGFQVQTLPGSGSYVRDTEAYSATIRAELGFVELTSVSGYNFDRNTSHFDQTAGFGGLATAYFPASIGVTQQFVIDVKKYTQELRTQVPVGRSIIWLLGGYFTSEKAAQHSNFLAVDQAGTELGNVFGTVSPSTFKEYSVFTNLTVKLTDRFDAQLGGRLSHSKQTYGGFLTGKFTEDVFGSDPFTQPNFGSKDHAFTYQFTPRFKITPDIMFYARVASGYRPGGPNTACGSPDVPCEYDRDTTINYEIGVKGSVLNRVLTFDASAYYIDWKNIQISLSTGIFGYQGNASRAKSQGLELTVEMRPTTGMTISTWVAWNDAKLTRDFPATASAFGQSGDRLPYSSRFSGNFSVDQEFPLAAAMTGFIGGSLSFTGKRIGIFQAFNTSREMLPAYTQFDLIAGARLGGWTINTFINNVTDKRGVLRTGVDNFRPTYFSYIQPRTIGLSLAKAF